MISGKAFKEICNWNLCNRYPINFEATLVKENDLIFVNLDNINNFLRMLSNNILMCKIRLITHNSDNSFTVNELNNLRKYVNKLYATNCVIKDELITKIPIGFSDRLVPVIQKINKNVDKEHLLYMNFNLHSGRISERTECYNDHNIFIESNISEENYYCTLSKSKYVLCPIGAGLDTHRFYEAIYFNTIPIIVRNDISDLHNKYPCIILNKWSELTEYFLINNYESYYNEMLMWKEYNQNWCDVNFYI